MASRRRSFLALAALLAATLVTCKPSVDPDKGRYSCSTDSDCGPDFSCSQQAAGGSLCFKKGTCFAETCNGKDDDCNGLVDETFPTTDQTCLTGEPGVCTPGKVRCVDAGERCVNLMEPSVELCNGKDDDCNGATDETFTLASDNLNCGACAQACPAGTSCQLGVCRETNCADGIDNDSDGGLDCADPSCQQLTCFTVGDAAYVCGKFPDSSDGGQDAGLPDAGLDAGPTDAGDPDAGLDAGPTDAGDPDAGLDAGAADAGDSDAGLDAGLSDAGDSDAGLDAGPADAGLDAGLDAGTDGGRFFCFPAEQCDDAIDNDGDALTDCADPDCNNRTCVGGTVCTNGVCPGPG